MGFAWCVPEGFPYRLALLFDFVHPPDRDCLTNDEVAAAVNEQAGKPVITGEYLSRLRRGEDTDPGLSVISAIAKAFGVSVAYFTDEITDAQARCAAIAARSGTAPPMTAELMALELRVATSSAIKEVVNRWAGRSVVQPRRPPDDRFAPGIAELTARS
jgi:transcriptional regulator with XRE-family HTH domain